MLPKHEAVAADLPVRIFAMKPRPLRVLIVEDDPIIAIDLEMLLEELGTEVVGIAISAAEAVALVWEHSPDIVTMDIDLTGACDGVTAAREIYEFSGIRSIFISALADEVTRERAVPCHQIGWIVKPVSKSRLAALLARVKRHNH